MKYSILAQWREEDQCYVVLPPEFAEGVLAPEADGATYAEAMAQGVDALEHLVELFHRQGEVASMHAAIKKAIEEVKAALASR